MQEGPDSKELDGWTLAPVERAGHHAGGKNTAWCLGAMLTFIT